MKPIPIAMFLSDDGREWLLDLEAQCTATTVHGRRCMNPVYPSQVWWHEGGTLTIDARDLARGAALLCPLHFGKLHPDERSQYTPASAIEVEPERAAAIRRAVQRLKEQTPR